MRVASLLATSLLLVGLAAGRAAANSCQTEHLLPAHQTLPAGCPLVLYVRAGAIHGFEPAAVVVTARRGDASVRVDTAIAAAGVGDAPVWRTIFDTHACLWRDEIQTLPFDRFRVQVATQPGDVLSFDSPFTVTVGPAGACPADAISWSPACADPLPPPACEPFGGDVHGCDGGLEPEATGEGGETGGCAAGGHGGHGGSVLAVLAGALVAWSRRRIRPAQR